MQKALYYPYIDITSEAWLKNAMLYWDTISTIVPESIKDPYKTRTAKEFFDEGCIESIKVNSNMLEIEELTENVLDYIDSDQGRNVLYRGISHIHPDKLPSDIQRLARIHPDKLPFEIRYTLENKMEDGEWFSVDSGFANFYMTLLAFKLSNKQKISLLTNQNDYDSLSMVIRLNNQLPRICSYSEEYEYFNRMHHRRGNLQREFSKGLLLNLMIENISIDPNTTVKQIIQFKKEYKEELENFRTQLKRLSNNIGTFNNGDELIENCNHTINDNFIPSINKLKEKLNDCMIAWRTDVIEKLIFSSLIPNVTHNINIPYAIPLFFGASIFLTISIIRYDINRRRELRDNPYSYILLDKLEL